MCNQEINMKIFKLNNIDFQKGTVAFTWDDNLTSHTQIIAPLFLKFNKKCSFYINPGEPNFDTLFADLYQHLKLQGFEIGSHGYTHCHYSYLTDKEYIAQIKNSISSIVHIFQTQPTTFAFPHHDYDEKMLSQARNLFFETRNSLYNSVRFSLKTNTNIEQINEALRNAIHNRYTIVFSGHGAFYEEENLNACGYEPISDKQLHSILKIISQYEELQICTFEQAALKTYLQYHCETYGDVILLSDLKLAFLKQYGLTEERICNLI